MFISKQLKQQSIAEYLIYMWQVEDLIRAYGCDLERIREELVPRFPAEQQGELAQWYEDLIEMMRREEGANKEEPELETCFEALYGILLLKLQKKEIGEETKRAQEAITTMLSMLSTYYIEDKKGDLEF